MDIQKKQLQYGQLIDLLNEVQLQNVQMHMILEKPSGASRGFEPDNKRGYLLHGDRFRLSLIAPLDGYLTLLNLGSGGSVGTLCPAESGAPPRIGRGRLYYLGRGMNMVSLDEEAMFLREEKPESLRNEVALDRLLAIVTRERGRVKPSSLYPLWAGDDANFRGIGAHALSIFEMPPEDWAWGLLQVEVR